MNFLSSFVIKCIIIILSSSSNSSSGSNSSYQKLGNSEDLGVESKVLKNHYNSKQLKIFINL